MSNNGPKLDGAALHQAAVERAHELGGDAVAQARAVKDALGLPEAPVSPNAPPPYPAPFVPAPTYPPRPAAAQEPAAQEPAAQEPPTAQTPAQDEPQTDG